MKNKKIIIPFVPLFCVMILSGCNRTEGKYVVNTIVEEKPDIYVYTTNNVVPSLIKDETISGKMPIYFINGSSVPYISIKAGVEDCYLNPLQIYYPGLFKGYTHSTKDNKTTITNLANNYTCVIDYKNQTMEFKDYQAFTNNADGQVTPLDASLTGGRNYFKNVNKVKYVAPKSSYVIDFKKYNIPLYCKDNIGYIPNEVFNNVLGFVPTADYTYVNGKIYCSAGGYFTASSINNKLILNKVINAKFSSEYMEYCYNLNALTLDINYGLRKRESRAIDGYTINYNIDGYANLNKYGKDKFLSNEPNIANQALIDAVDNEYDDMGHTLNWEASFIDNKAPEPNTGKEYNLYEKLTNSFTSSRLDAGFDPTTTTKNPNAKGDFKVINGSQEYNDTAFLTIDRFVEPSGDYKTLDYCTNTLSLIYNVNNQLRTTEGKKIKNLVIDLSLNGGGTVYTEMFMSSWLTKGQTHQKNCSFLTGAFSDYTYQADVDGDGDITENDFLPDTVKKVYVIISPCTFSSGNLLATDLRDYRSGVTFVGNRTGGGACAVRTGIQSGYGTTYKTSSNYVMCLNEADENNLITNDGGVKVDAALQFPISNPSLYYNRALLVDILHLPF